MHTIISLLRLMHLAVSVAAAVAVRVGALPSRWRPYMVWNGPHLCAGCVAAAATAQAVQVELLPIGPRAVPAMSAGAIAELDSFTFDEPSLAAKGVTERQLRHASSSNAVVAPGDAAAPLSCHVCKCEYVVGDRLRQLPCKHVFHKACIDQWIGCYHATCPICRKNLLGSHKSPRIPSRMLASSGRAESANVSARRHLSGGYSGIGYTDSMPSASSGGFDGDGPRFGTGSALPPPSPCPPRQRRNPRTRVHVPRPGLSCPAQAYNCVPPLQTRTAPCHTDFSAPPWSCNPAVSPAVPLQSGAADCPCVSWQLLRFRSMCDGGGRAACRGHCVVQ